MKEIYCENLGDFVTPKLVSGSHNKTKLIFICKNSGELVDDLCIDYKQGSSETFYINCPKYNWLYLFLLNNKIAYPTYNCIVVDNNVYEEFYI